MTPTPRFTSRWNSIAAATVPGSRTIGSRACRGYTSHLPPGPGGPVDSREADADCRATPTSITFRPVHVQYDVFVSLPPGKIDLPARSRGLVRPGKHNRTPVLARTVDAGGGSPSRCTTKSMSAEIRNRRDRSAEVQEIAAFNCNFTVDAASVIMSTKNQQYRLPKGDPRYDQPFPAGWPRDIRECQSERYLVNVHGTFYEMPRQNGLPQIKPVCSHGRQIMDFFTWRGLLVMTGNRTDAQPDGQYFHSRLPGRRAMVRHVDDLWRLGSRWARRPCSPPATPAKPPTLPDDWL